MPSSPLIIDALNIPTPERRWFEEWRAGGVGAVNVTLAIWENSEETVRYIGKWRRVIDENSDVVGLATSSEDIERLAAAGAGLAVDIGAVVGQRHFAGPVTREGERDPGPHHAFEAGGVAVAFVELVARRVRIGPHHAHDRAPLDALAAEAAQVLAEQLRIAAPERHAQSATSVVRFAAATSQP